MREKAARKRLLVIDDDERVLISLEHLLETEGYETTTAWSGQEGLALLRSQGFDLVLLDDYLRDIELEEIFEDVRMMEVQPPVILTESAPKSDARRHYLDLGATAIVSKWAPLKEIAAEIQKCFRSSPLEAIAV